MIPDEPVRGRTPPPWFRALSGIERMRAFSRSLVPSPPIARPLGYRATHVAAGRTTIVMPASDACISPNGQLEIVPAAVTALEGATLTALPGGVDAIPMRLTFKAFRPAWPGKGNILARARIVNDSHLFVFAEVQVEDPDGRYLGQGSLHSMIQQVEPAPPVPPPTLNRIEEPVYETPVPTCAGSPAPRSSISSSVRMASRLYGKSLTAASRHRRRPRSDSQSTTSNTGMSASPCPRANGSVAWVRRCPVRPLEHSRTSVPGVRLSASSASGQP